MFIAAAPPAVRGHENLLLVLGQQQMAHPQKAGAARGHEFVFEHWRKKLSDSPARPSDFNREVYYRRNEEQRSFRMVRRRSHQL